MKPETKTCENCHKTFLVETDDLDFYALIGVQVPSECPTCRRNRRLAFGNYTTLYQRKNDSPKGGKMISCYPDDAPFPVFDFDYYWSNEHHPEDYHLDYSPSGSFFEQFEKLHTITPRPSLTRDPSNIDSEYCNYGNNLKNCFYSFGGMAAENVNYSMWGFSSRDCDDMLIALNCERLYESVFSEHSHSSSFLYFSKNILGSTFMYDCRDCTDCIGCVNLRHKKYHVFNRDVGEAEYRRIREELASGNNAVYKKYADQFWDLVQRLPIRGERNEHAVNSTGMYLMYSNNLKESVWSLQSANSKWLEFVLKVRDSHDVTISTESERMYNTALTGRQSWNNICTVNCRTSGDCEYSIDLSDCTNCFGCIGLSNKKFCILNKQYSEQEYREIVEKIRTEMRAKNQYGAFFPYSVSPFPYNASLAHIIFPKTKEEIETIGSYYSEPESNTAKDAQLVQTTDLPHEITNTVIADVEHPIASEQSGRPFRIRESDLLFYKQQKVPLPLRHPHERMLDRFSIVNNFIIEDCVCKKCGIAFKGVLPSSAYITYCDSCYINEIN